MVSVLHRMWQGTDRATTVCVPPLWCRVPVRVVGQGQMHNSKATRLPSIQSDRVLNHLFRMSSTTCPLYIPTYRSPVSAMTVTSPPVGTEPRSRPDTGIRRRGRHLGQLTRCFAKSAALLKSIAVTWLTGHDPAGHAKPGCRRVVAVWAIGARDDGVGRAFPLSCPDVERVVQWVMIRRPAELGQPAVVSMLWHVVARVEFALRNGRLLWKL